MSSYKNYIITSTLFLCLAGCANSANIESIENDFVKKTVVNPKVKYFNLEDPYIMYAIEYENQEDYESSRKIFLKLFENTNKYEYLVEYLNLSFILKDYENVKKYVSLYMIEGIKEEEQMLRLYTFSLLKLNEKEETLKYAKKLVNKFHHNSNHNLLASVYFDLKEYMKAEEEFIKSYKIDNSINTLQTITNIQYYYTNKKEQSEKTIKEYIKKNFYPFTLSLQLLSFYEKDNKKEEILPLLEKMHAYYKKNDIQPSLWETQNLLIRYLVKEDKKKAIKFLEENNIESTLLLTLYKNTNELKKASELLNGLYKETNNLDFLAQQAIIEFELAKNKKTVLTSVIAKLDKVLTKISNPFYENYLAYILIDYDLDIQRGLILVKKALSVEPENLAFIDTLAWGEYKNNDCENAYKNMKKVIDNVKFDDDEIKLHWEKIKECSK